MPKPWDSIVEFMPDTIRKTVEPELEKAFNAYEEKLQRYAEYEDYVEKYEPEQLANALAYAQQLESDPQEVMRKLGDYLKDQGVDPATVLGIQQQVIKEATDDAAKNNSGGTDDASAAISKALEEKFNELTGKFDQLAKFTVESHKMTQAEKQEEALRKAIDALEEKHKDEPFDRDFILERVAQGETPEQAVKTLHNLLNKFDVGQKKADDGIPTFLGSGALPSNQVPISDLSESELVDLSVRYLESQAGS